MDCPKAEFSGFTQGDGLVKPPWFRQQDRDLVAGRAVQPFFVVVSSPSLQLFGRVRKRKDPVLVQAFGSEAAMERFEKRIVGRFPWPREVVHDAPLIGPEIHVALDKLADLIDPDRLGMAGRSEHPVERRDHIFAAVTVAHTEHFNVVRESVDDS